MERPNCPISIDRYAVRPRNLLLLALAPAPCTAQLVLWAEDFENGCVQNCAATTYTGPNGAWSTMNTGTNGACANIWFVSCQENGNPVGACGSGCGTNETLHIGNNAAGCASPNGCFFCPSGDCGAAYDASCPPALCFVCCSCQSSQSDTRAVSPIINTVGQAGLTLRFKYMEGGSGTTDNALLDYYDGTVWSTLVDLPKTPVGGCGGQGTWTAYSIALPASANNNPSMRIGFRWVNDDDGNGTDPSVAIDDVEVLTTWTPNCAGPIINELSNGTTANREYVELLVCGPSCSTIDLRGWKIDDNNGILMNGFGGAQSGSGVAAGHLRFANIPQWAAVPTGSLIVLYNVNDVNPLVPPNDPADTSPADGVYVLPATDPAIQGCPTQPDPLGTASYGTACTYGAGNWTFIGLRNQGDAAQTRDPLGRYFHGVSYGSDAQGMNTGGLDLLRISLLDHTGRVVYFNSGSERLAANFTSAAVAGNETPGAPNNTANLALINSLLCSPLPVELLYFTAEAMSGHTHTRWATASEFNSAEFIIERAGPDGHFGIVGRVPAAGFSQQQVNYTWDDPHPLAGLSYYRLHERDLDGAEQWGSTVAVEHPASGAQVYALTGQLAVVISGIGSSWVLLDLAGRTMSTGSTAEGNARMEVPMGISLLRVSTGTGERVYRLTATRDEVFVDPVE